MLRFKFVWWEAAAACILHVPYVRVVEDVQQAFLADCVPDALTWAGGLTDRLLHFHLWPCPFGFLTWADGLKRVCEYLCVCADARCGILFPGCCCMWVNVQKALPHLI